MVIWSTEMKIVVVSLFDGLSGGRIAFDRVEDVEVVRYYSSEIDKYAIQVADVNYPQDTPYRLGDITKVDGIKLLSEIREEFGDIDIVLIGGSPCQGFSMAGKMKGSSTACGIDVTSLEQYMDLKAQDFEFNGQSYLFWEFVRLQKEINPKYFMLENVRITKKWLPMFNETMGTEVQVIFSSKVVPQRRERFYWHNIAGVGQPQQKEYDVSDFFGGDGFPSSCDVSRFFKRKEIFNTLTATYWKGIRGSSRPTVSAREGFLDEDRDAHRMLTAEECEKLQTIPIGYTNCVSKTQRYKMIGNGWTIDVVAHIFRHIPIQEVVEEIDKTNTVQDS